MTARATASDLREKLESVKRDLESAGPDYVGSLGGPVLPRDELLRRVAAMDEVLAGVEAEQRSRGIAASC